MLFETNQLQFWTSCLQSHPKAAHSPIRKGNHWRCCCSVAGLLWPKRCYPQQEPSLSELLRHGWEHWAVLQEESASPAAVCATCHYHRIVYTTSLGWENYDFIFFPTLALWSCSCSVLHHLNTGSYQMCHVVCLFFDSFTKPFSYIEQLALVLYKIKWTF